VVVPPTPLPDHFTVAPFCGLTLPEDGVAADATPATKQHVMNKKSGRMLRVKLLAQPKQNPSTGELLSIFIFEWEQSGNNMAMTKANFCISTSKTSNQQTCSFHNSPQGSLSPQAFDNQFISFQPTV
jgi:hypothetical protein